MEELMTIEEIADKCRQMHLGETRTFQLSHDQAMVEVCLKLGTLQADFVFRLNEDDDWVVHRTHIGPYPDSPFP